MRLGGQEEEGQLLSGPVPAAAAQTGTEEGDLRRRGVDAHGDLPHAEGRRALQGPRCRLLPATVTRGPRTEPRTADCQAWLCLHDCPSTAGGSFYLDGVQRALRHKGEVEIRVAPSGAGRPGTEDPG